jgi:hypothetical protein
MRRHWPIALLILAAGLFAATGATVQRNRDTQAVLTRGAAPLCAGTTREGRRCRNRTRSGWCWRHKPLAAPRPVAVDRT